MPDFADQASEAAALHLADSLARVRVPAGISAVVCEECGCTIPEARRRAVPGCRLCVSCKAEIERSE